MASHPCRASAREAMPRSRRESVRLAVGRRGRVVGRLRGEIGRARRIAHFTHAHAAHLMLCCHDFCTANDLHVRENHHLAQFMSSQPTDRGCPCEPCEIEISARDLMAARRPGVRHSLDTRIDTVSRQNRAEGHIDYAPSRHVHHVPCAAVHAPLDIMPPSINCIMSRSTARPAVAPPTPPPEEATGTFSIAWTSPPRQVRQHWPGDGLCNGGRSPSATLCNLWHRLLCALLSGTETNFVTPPLGAA